MELVNNICLNHVVRSTRSEMEKYFIFAHWYRTPLNDFEEKIQEKLPNFYSIMRDIKNLYFLEKDQLKILS